MAQTIMLLLSILGLYLSSVNAVSTYDFISIPFGEITIPQGNITGVIDVNGNYRKFLGIPYAVVNERFQAPGNPPKWEKTLYANIDNEACPQYLKLLGKSPIVGSEQCLGLNVFTPITTQEELLPVMVFIFGGGWYWGSNHHHLYNPRYLVEKKVVVVTINYRLGALGFLCLKNKGAPGNAGLKDQIAALKWVKSNIEYFGGDPNSVTLFGQDAGSASITFLMGSPLANGLFHRVIIQSGTMMVPLAFDNEPIKTASKIAAELGLNSTDPDELLEFYKQVSIDDLITASHKDSTNNPAAPYVFRPCVETADEEALITNSPSDLLKFANVNSNLTVIIGFNNKEGIIFASKYNYNGYRDLRGNFSKILPENMNFPTEDDKNSFVEEVKKLYFENNAIDKEGLIDYFTDTVLAYPTIAIAESLVNRTVSVYNYYFKYDSIRNIAKALDGMPKEPGASHGDELFYLFNPKLLQLQLPLKDDAELIYKMTSMWTSFALKGEPLYQLHNNWTKSSQELEFLEIDKTSFMIEMPNETRMKFWKNAYNKYGFKY